MHCDFPSDWKKPRRIFVNSMSDLFHPDVPAGSSKRVFERMKTAEQHHFRSSPSGADRLRKLDAKLTWSHNIWMGVSVENADVIERIDFLRRTMQR